MTPGSPIVGCRWIAASSASHQSGPTNHRNRSLAQLGRMSGEILDAFFSRYPIPFPAPGERPPMISLPEYRERFPAAAERAKKTA